MRPRTNRRPLVASLASALFVLPGCMQAASGTAVAGAKSPASDGPIVAAIAEPGHDPASRSLVALAAHLARSLGGHAAAISFERESHGIGRGWARWGAGRSVEVSNASSEEDAAAAVTAWAVEARPWALLATSTGWGREVAARVAAALGAGMIGDAVELDVTDGRLTAWKPAFSGQSLVSVGCTGAIQVATIRAGGLPQALPRPVFEEPRVAHVSVAPRRRVEVLDRTRDGHADRIAAARRIVGVGRGVDPTELHLLAPLTELLDATGASTADFDRLVLRRTMALRYLLARNARLLEPSEAELHAAFESPRYADLRATGTTFNAARAQVRQDLLRQGLPSATP